MTTTSPSAPATSNISLPACRFCGKPLQHTFIDLGMSPLCESYPSAADLHRGETYYPLHVRVCDSCFLVQLEEYESADNIFTDYAYFSSFSDSWLNHCQTYCKDMIDRFQLDSKSFVVEVASNDGYLLQYFVEQRIPVLGIEPAKNVASAALEKGVPTMVEFFGKQLADKLAGEGRQADLVLGNNVLAQVPDLNDFVSGLAALLKPGGVLTLEFPHLLRLIDGNEFDTIYHEHFSYFSLGTAVEILKKHDLTVFDIDELPTHGGSLRVYACRSACNRQTSSSVAKVLQMEASANLRTLRGYEGFGEKVKQTKFAFLEFLLSAAQSGKTVAGYGAPGKSATLLNYCGVGKDLIHFTVDRNPYKHGRFLPGTRIPIFPPDHIREQKPDYIVILPWNLKTEIMAQLQYVREWGGQLVVPIPFLTIY
ncbi:MAG: class I SAM-dependent methyltransferase [Bryobacteraceae bacterium]|nr:class I SAM-dependent methyltransferase [Bryobacteraceae bacterium]